MSPAELKMQPTILPKLSWLFEILYCFKMNDEKTHMILIYGERNKNASAVARLCRQ
jgi:hypothetical protein